MVKNSRQCCEDVALEGEVAGEQAHHQRAGDVLEQRRERKRRAEQPRRGEIDAVAQRRADAAAEKHDQKAHRQLFRSSGMKKPPCGGWTESYRQLTR